MSVSRKALYPSVIAACAFVVYLLLGGSYYTLAVLTPVMASDLGWSATAFGVAFSLFALSSGLTAPLVGAFVIRYGSRRAILIGALLVAIGLALLSTTTEIWQLYAFATVHGLGVGVGAVLPVQQLVGNWFVRRRSLALGLVLTGAGVGGLILAPLTSSLETAFDSWHPVWLALAGLVLVPTLLAVVLIRNRPTEVGHGAHGVARDPAPDPSGTMHEDTRRVYRTAREWGTKAAIGTGSFWLFALAVGAMYFLLQAATAHQVAYLVDEAGLDLTLAASALGLIPGSSIAGRLAAGWLGDRAEPRLIITGLLLLMGVGLAVLVTAGGVAGVYVYVALFGIGYGGIIVLAPAVVLNYYGSRSYAQIMGIAAPIGTILGAVSPVIMGALRDAYGGYRPGFVAMIVVAVAGAACSYLAMPPIPEPVAEQSLSAMP